VAGNRRGRARSEGKAYAAPSALRTAHSQPGGSCMVVWGRVPRRQLGVGLTPSLLTTSARAAGAAAAATAAAAAAAALEVAAFLGFCGA
jgi:hypothetical protein